MRATRPTLRGFAVAAAVAAIGFLLAACGSSNPANSNSTTTPSNAQAVKFAQCMRANGVPDFPDPGSQGLQMQSQGNGSSISVNGVHLNVSAPAFKKAQQKCRKDAPQGPPTTPALLAQARKHALAMAKCMRAHGVPNFPDPQVKAGPGGRGIAVKIGAQAAGSGLNPRSPAFRAAQKTCMPLMRIGAKAKASGSG